MQQNNHTEFHRFLQRQDKESLLGQRGIVIWLCGLSGSGKSTIANAAGCPGKGGMRVVAVQVVNPCGNE